MDFFSEKSHKFRTGHNRTNLVMRFDTKISFLIGFLTPISFYCYLNNRITSDHADTYLSHTSANRLSAYYQCYKQPRAVDEVLKSFRRFYPFSEVIMVNDGGDPALIQDIAAHYNAKFWYSPQRTSDRNDSMFFSSYLAAHTYIARIIDASANCDWLLLLEDDVWILGHIPFHQFRHVLNGGHPAMILDSVLVKTFAPPNTTETGLQSWQYAGNGGTVLRCSFYRDLNLHPRWNTTVSALIDAKPTIASDELLSSVTYAAGGTIGAFEAYAEPSFVTFFYRLLAGDIAVLHQAKYLYDAHSVADQ